MQTPKSTPRKLRSNQGIGRVLATRIAEGVAAAIGKKMGEGAFSTAKSSTSMDIDSKDTPHGRTYVQKKQSKRTTKKKVKKLIRQKKFQGKVLNAINEGQLGTKVVTFRDSDFISAVGQDTQNFMSTCFYGNQPLAFATARGYRDLYRIVNQDTMGGGPGAKIQITSMYASVQLFNNNQPQFFVDIYEVTNKKNETSTETFLGNWQAALLESGAQASATSVAAGTLGQTPFGAPLFMQKFSVVSKTTVALGTNETYKWEVKRGIPFTYDFDKMSEYQYLRPTFGYIFVLYGRSAVVGGVSVAAQGIPNQSLVISTQRTYFYKRTVQGTNGPTDTAVGGLNS